MNFRPNRFLAIVFLIVPVVAAVSPPTGRAEEAIDWFEVQGSAQVDHGDLDEARRAALAQVREAAFGLAVCDIDLAGIMANFRLSGNSASAVPFLQVNAEERLQENVANQRQGGADRRIDRYCSITSRVGLSRVFRKSNADFNISAALNKTCFADGEEMRVHLRSNYSCNYSIYIITADEGISRLVPSVLKSANRIRAGETVVFPDDGEIKKGIRLRVHVPAGQTSTTETIFILALRDSALPDDKEMREAVYGLYDGQADIPLKAFISKIAAVPLERRSEYFLRYMIHPKR